MKQWVCCQGYCADLSLMVQDPFGGGSVVIFQRGPQARLARVRRLQMPPIQKPRQKKEDKHGDRQRLSHGILKRIIPFFHARGPSVKSGRPANNGRQEKPEATHSPPPDFKVSFINPRVPYEWNRRMTGSDVRIESKLSEKPAGGVAADFPSILARVVAFARC